MRNTLILMILGISVLFSSFTLNNKGAENSDIPKQQEIQSQNAIRYHWFFIRIRIDERKKKYFIVGNASRVVQGTIDEFRQKLWWGITHKQLAIGPFMSAEEADVARLYYKNNRERIPKDIDAPKTEVHWFLLTVKELKRANAYKLERMPARTASGTIEDFIDALYEGMTFEHLVVGAFWNYDQAEYAKSIYRENE